MRTIAKFHSWVSAAGKKAIFLKSSLIAVTNATFDSVSLELWLSYPAVTLNRISEVRKEQVT